LSYKTQQKLGDDMQLANDQYVMGIVYEVPIYGKIQNEFTSFKILPKSLDKFSLYKNPVRTQGALLHDYPQEFSLYGAGYNLPAAVMPADKNKKRGATRRPPLKHGGGDFHRPPIGGHYRAVLIPLYLIKVGRHP